MYQLITIELRVRVRLHFDLSVLKTDVSAMLGRFDFCEPITILYEIPDVCVCVEKLNSKARRKRAMSKSGIEVKCFVLYGIVVLFPYVMRNRESLVVSSILKLFHSTVD